MTRFRFAGATLALMACVTTTLGAQAVLSRLGVSETQAGERFVDAVQNGGSPGIAARAFLALPASARAAAVTELVAWAKAYYKSPAFKKAWADTRDANKPDAPAASADAVIAKQKADQEKQMADVKKMLESLPPEQRKAVEESLKQSEATMKDPAYQAKMAESAQHMNADDKARYQEELKTWQQNYPVDPSPVIAKRIRDFLAQTADVDFNAKVAGSGGGKTFANPDYEAKSSQWKMAYRAGREATTAARAAATTWLSELGQ